MVATVNNAGMSCEEYVEGYQTHQLFRTSLWRSEIKPSESKPDRGTVTMRSTTKNQEGKTVMVMNSKLVVPKQNTKQSTHQ